MESEVPTAMMKREEAANWFEAFMLDYHDQMEVPDDLPYEVAEG